MKAIIKIAVNGIVIITFLFVAAVFFVNAKGKQILAKKLSEAFQAEVEIGMLNVIFPLGLHIRDFRVKGYGFVKDIDMGSGVFYLFRKDLNFSYIVLNQPQLTVHRTKTNTFGVGEPPKEEKPQEDQAAPAQAVPDEQDVGQKPLPPPDQRVSSRDIPHFNVDRFVVKNGVVNFFDYSKEEGISHLTVKNVDIKLRDMSYPFRSGKTHFDLKAAVLGDDPAKQSSAGSLSGRGWADFMKKDMKGELKVADLNAAAFLIQLGIPLSEELKNFMGDLSLDLESQNNAMTVKGKLQVKDFAFNLSKGGDEKNQSLESMLLEGLQSLAKEVQIEFQFKTKMDDFKVESVSFTGNIFGKKFGGTQEKFALAGR